MFFTAIINIQYYRVRYLHLNDFLPDTNYLRMIYITPVTSWQVWNLHILAARIWCNHQLII